MRLLNDPHGRPWLAMYYTWWEDEYGNPQEVTLQAVKEFRYDSGRGRYLVRERCPDQEGCGEVGYMEVLSETWTDYDGEDYYADWEVVDGDPEELMGYMPGVWQMAAGGQPECLHGDQIGTTRLMTDSSDPYPQVVRQSVYTAFGELVWTADGSAETRYGYAGAHGYEEGLIPQAGSTAYFPFLHVGARWYDPVTGRFLQRDPIGINGGLNVYGYVTSCPTILADPSGLRTDMGWDEPPGGYPRVKVRPSKASHCEPTLREDLAGVGVAITGGEDSWLDDANKVEAASDWFEELGRITACLAAGALAKAGYWIEASVVGYTATR